MYMRQLVWQLKVPVYSRTVFVSYNCLFIQNFEGYIRDCWMDCKVHNGLMVNCICIQFGYNVSRGIDDY